MCSLLSILKGCDAILGHTPLSLLQQWKSGLEEMILSEKLNTRHIYDWLPVKIYPFSAKSAKTRDYDTRKGPNCGWQEQRAITCWDGWLSSSNIWLIWACTYDRKHCCLTLSAALAKK